MATEEFFEEDVVVIAVPNWENKKRENLEQQGILFINGEINCNLVGAISRAILSHIHAEKKLTEIKVYINSEGGDLWGGWMLYDLLRYASKNGIRVVTIAIGKVQSAATLPFLAGDVRITAPNTIFTIHEASSWLAGKTSEQKDYLKFLSDRENAYLDLVASRTKISKRTLKAKSYRKDWNFTAKEAVKMGFAHELLLEE